MKKSNGGLINSLVLIAFSCMSCISLISKTPRNIDPNPILSTQLDENPVVSSTVMKIRNSADTVEKVFRDIEIFRCNTRMKLSNNMILTRQHLWKEDQHVECIASGTQMATCIMPHTKGFVLIIITGSPTES